METEEHGRSWQARRHRALQGSCKQEQEELRAKTQREQQGALRNEVLLIFLGCLDAVLSGIIVLHLCLSSAPTLLIVLEMKAATMALLLIIAPLDGSQNKLPSAPEYIRRMSLIFPGESSHL